MIRQDILATQHLLLKIDRALTKAEIGQDARPFNSDGRTDKYDKVISMDDEQPSRFGYHNDMSVIMADFLFDEDGVSDNIVRQVNKYLVRQSYFEALPPEQKHNPADLEDLFAHWVMTKPKQNAASQKHSNRDTYDAIVVRIADILNGFEKDIANIGREYPEAQSVAKTLLTQLNAHK